MLKEHLGGEAVLSLGVKKGALDFKLLRRLLLT